MRRGRWLPRVGADLLYRVLALCLLIVPPALLVTLGARVFLDRADRALGALTPIVAREASVYFGRPVSVGAIGPDITLARLWDLWRHPESVGRFPVVLSDLEIGLRPEERRAAGRPFLLRVRRIAVDVSAPGLRGPAPAQYALPLVRVEGLDLVLVRDSKGEFPIARLIPDTGKPVDNTQPPFRTRLEIGDASIWLRDYAAGPGRARGVPEDNRFAVADALADLSGWRAIRFSLPVKAQPGSRTARFLEGAVRVEGHVARGKPGDRPDAPSPGLPAFGIEAKVQGIDLPYVRSYLGLSLPVDLRAGRADLSALVRDDGPGRPPVVQAHAVLRGGSLRTPELPRLPIDRIDATVDYAGGVLRVVGAADALGKRVRADAVLGGLDHPAVPASLFARIDVPELSIRTLRAALPPVALPPELVPGDTLSLSDLVLSGTVKQPQVRALVVATGVGWKGFPRLERVSARVTWDDGVAVATPIEGQWEGGGTITGRARYVLATRRLQTDLRLRDIDLARVAALREVDARVRPTGRVSGLARLRVKIGSERPEVEGAAFARADQLRVGTISLPSADVDLTLAGRRVQVRRLRLGGNVGIASVRADIDLDKGLRANATLVGVDLARVGDAFGQPGLDGVLSVTASAEGTLQRPVFTLRDLSVLGARASFGGRELSPDAIRGDQVRVSLLADERLLVDLTQPLRVSLYPAEVTVAGKVGGRLSALEFDLNAQATNLDIGRILPALLGEPALYASPGLRANPHYVALARDLGWADSPPPVAGRVTLARAHVTGSPDSLRVAGDVALRQMRVGTFPLESGSANFTWEDGGLSVRDGVLSASPGTVRFAATMGSDGALDGAFSVAALRLERLEPLLGQQVSLAGELKLEGALSGSRTQPALRLKTSVSDPVTVAGVVLEGLAVGEAAASLAVVPDAPISGTVSIDAARFRIAGALAEARQVRFSLPERAVQAEARLDVPSLQDLVQALATVPAEENAANEALRRLADTLPADIGGTYQATLSGAAVIGDDGLLKTPRAQATLQGTDIRIGPVGFPTAAARANLVDRTVTIEQLNLESPNAIVDGGGTLVFPQEVGGPVGLDLRLESLQPSLELVRAFVPRFPVFGVLDSVTLVARGTSENPRLQATLEGAQLVFKDADRKPLTIDQFRLNARLAREADGDLVLGLDDGLLTRGDEEVRIDVALPVDRERGRVLASRPIRRMEVRIRDVRLESLATFLNLPVEKVDGLLSGRVALEGSLNAPTLAGEVAVRDATASFPRVGAARREPLNPITDFDLDVTLAGRNVTIRQARLALGSPAGDRRKPGGTVTGSGDIRIDNLEDFTLLFTRRAEGDPAPRLRGAFSLKAQIEGLRPDIDNLTGLLGVRDARGQVGLAEAATGVVDGEVNITGPLLAPVVSTNPGRELRLTDVALRLPRPAAVSERKAAPALNPKWQVSLDVPTEARVVVLDSPVTRLEFRGRGNVTLSGSLADPSVEGTLVPTGGFLRYPLARLDLQRGGTAQIAYGGQRVGVNLSGVVAEGKITGIVGGGNRRSNDTGLINTNLGSGGAGLETTYRVQAAFNGAVDLSGGSGIDLLQQVTLSSEPPLSRQDIVDLLGARRQFDLIASGDAEQAVRDLGSRFVESGLLSGLFRPITSNVRSAFGLDAFDLSYNLDGTAFFRVVRRLPAPLERFTIDISKSFTTRETSSTSLPYRFGLNYELFQLKARGRFQPRLLLGIAATSEQRDTLFFVRGTVNY